jgi:uncharacterized protein
MNEPSTLRIDECPQLGQVLLPIHTIAVTTVTRHIENPLVYKGIDASIAPGLLLPESVAFGMEQIFPDQFGALGTLTTVSSITAAIKSINQDRRKEVLLTGYNGLMLPVMEDVVLAERARDGKFTLRDLLLFSTVCGVGIDTVPVPGDVSIDALAGLYSEIHTISQRLGKPLTCRVLPIGNPNLSQLHPKLY